MARGGRRAEKEQFWQWVIEEHAQSGLSTREFCKRESISEPSFYSWRRRLADRDRPSETSGSSAPAATFDARGLVAVHVTGSAPRMIEIVGFAGIVVRLPEDCPSETICRVLGALLPSGEPHLASSFKLGVF